jgi:hypothetical protein
MKTYTNKAAPAKEGVSAAREATERAFSQTINLFVSEGSLKPNLA